MKERKFIGIDIGSVSLKAVVVNENKQVLESHYIRTHGQPVDTSIRVLTDLFSRHPRGEVVGMAATGSGGKLLAEGLGVTFVNEGGGPRKGTPPPPPPGPGPLKKGGG